MLGNIIAIGSLLDPSILYAQKVAYFTFLFSCSLSLFFLRLKPIFLKHEVHSYYDRAILLGTSTLSAIITVGLNHGNRMQLHSLEFISCTHFV